MAPLAANLEHFAQDLQLNSTPIAPGSTTPSEILDLTDTLRHHMNSGIHTKSATQQYSAPPHRFVLPCRVLISRVRGQIARRGAHALLKSPLADSTHTGGAQQTTVDCRGFMCSAVQSHSHSQPEQTTAR